MAVRLFMGASYAWGGWLPAWRWQAICTNHRDVTQINTSLIKLKQIKSNVVAPMESNQTKSNQIKSRSCHMMLIWFDSIRFGLIRLGRPHSIWFVLNLVRLVWYQSRRGGGAQQSTGWPCACPCSQYYGDEHKNFEPKRLSAYQCKSTEIYGLSENSNV